MGEEKTVYVITCWGYSDHRVIAATTDKEKAEKIRNLYRGCDEIIEVEEYHDGAIANYYPSWWVKFDLDGNVKSVWGPYTERITDDEGDIREGYREYHVYVYAENAECAKMMACDKFAEQMRRTGDE